MEVLIITLLACAPIIPLWRRVGHDIAIWFENDGRYSSKIDSIDRCSAGPLVAGFTFGLIWSIPWPLTGSLYMISHGKGYKFFQPPKEQRNHAKLERKRIEQKNKERMQEEIRLNYENRIAALEAECNIPSIKM